MKTFTTLAGDRSIRLAVVTGSGRAFTAGMDVNVLRDLDVPQAKAIRVLGRRPQGAGRTRVRTSADSPAR